MERARRVHAVALFADERRGGVDQFPQVLQPILAFALVLVKSREAARAHHVLDGLRQAHLLRLGAHLRRSAFANASPRLEPALPATYGIAAAIEQL